MAASRLPETGARAGARAGVAAGVLAVAALGTLGLRDGTLGVAWVSMRATLHQPLSGLASVLLAGTAGYLATATLSGSLFRRYGAGRVLAAGATSAAGALAGIALAPSFPVLLLAGLGLGLANGVVDTGVNTHVALHGGVRLTGLVHASYGIGATAGPLLVSAVLAGDAGWRAVYAVLLAVEALLAAGVWWTVPAWGGPGDMDAGPGRTGGSGPAAGAGRAGLLLLTLVLFFVYTGLEITAGEWGYSLLAVGHHLSRPAAAAWISGYWAALTAGRLALGARGHRFRPERVLATSAAVTVLGTVLVWWSPTASVGAAGFPVTGLGLAAVFPTLVSLTPRRLGRDRAATVIGLQLASAGLGGALLAAGAGWTGGRAGVRAIGGYLTGCAVVLLVLNTATTRRSLPPARARPAGPAGGSSRRTLKASEHPRWRRGSAR